MDIERPGEGNENAKKEKWSEHHLHIRAFAGEAAADLPVYPDNGGSSYGLWEDHVCKLVSEWAGEKGSWGCDPHQHLYQ